MKDCKGIKINTGIRFAFRCINCNYGLSVTSGVPAICPNCKGFLTFERITWEEYQKLQTTDGYDEKTI